MYTTVEVRWFFHGRIPDEVSDWFSSVAGIKETPEIRTDKYLWLPGMTSFGVKIRHQSLEIKLRTKEIGTVKLHQSADGCMEQWRKWSFALDQGPGKQHLAKYRDANWIKVHKERFLQRYEIKNGQEVNSIDPGHAPTAGCEVELTAIKLLDQYWWTFAFESFGDESTLIDSLTLLSATILNAGFPTLFPETRSFGYPQWLQADIDWP
jgi:hypothetical protein